jgi:LDH2 family malate/lactate/ureidoglycolate dehydrogenase
MQMGNFSVDELVAFYSEVLMKKGLSQFRAERVARVQVEIQAFGVTTHGLRPLNALIQQIGKERSVEAEPLVEKDTGPILVADCSKTLSIENVIYGVDQAEARASDHGLSFVALKKTGWVGALGYHLAETARRGHLVSVWGHSSKHHSVATFGGQGGRLSTNPMAFSFPTDGEPFVADFSTSAISAGRRGLMKARKERSQDPIFIDRDGNSSTDPNVADDGGSILPMGGRFYGYKGTALSFWIEAMSAAAGFQTANAQKKGGQNVHILVLKIESLGGLDHYRQMMDELIPFTLSSPPAEGSSEPRLSGARGWKALEDARILGISLDESLVLKLDELAEEFGLSAPRV